MTSSRFCLCLVLAAVCAAPGCAVSRRKYNEAQAQNRVLSEQNRAQLAEIENLRTHCRHVEDRLIRAEEDLALIEEQAGLSGEELAAFRRERAGLRDELTGLANRRRPLSPEVANKLAALSERNAGLHFDPATGVSKLDTDILFDSGEAELKRGADEVLAEMVRVLQSPEGADLKVVVAGHTDNRRIAGRPTREKYPNNFHLSAARALAVADALRAAGLEENRLGIAGFGAHQPVAPNVTPEDRRKNRRVELFVMMPEVPVVGWTETMPSLY